MVQFSLFIMVVVPQCEGITLKQDHQADMEHGDIVADETGTVGLINKVGLVGFSNLGASSTLSCCPF